MSAMTRPTSLASRIRSTTSACWVRMIFLGCRVFTDLRIEIQRELITGTAAIAGFASCLFGLFTNMPVALA